MISRVLVAWILIAAARGAGMGRAAGQDWPQWQGPGRDNVSGERGLLARWPEGGPAMVWSASGCGKGFSTVAVADGVIYTSGSTNGETFVIAFDLEGRALWQAPNGGSWEAAPRMAWAKNYDGARGTPTVADERVYHLGESGTLTAFDGRKGTSVWSLDIAKRFGAECPNYGYTESVLVDGDRLICCPGGTKGFMVALDRKTGETVWANTNIQEGVGFGSAILVEGKGLRQIVTMTEEGIIGVEASAGKLLWRHPFTNRRKNNIPTPVHRQGFILASTGYGGGSILLRLSYDDRKASVSEVWSNDNLDSMYGGFVVMDGCVYGAANRKPAWVCLDFETGRLRYREPGKAMGAATYADGMLYCLDQEGRMALVRCTPERHEVISHFTVPSGGAGKYWSCPVVCGGRLYVRHADRLYAYRVRPADK